MNYGAKKRLSEIADAWAGFVDWWTFFWFSRIAGEPRYCAGDSVDINYPGGDKKSGRVTGVNGYFADSDELPSEWHFEVEVFSSLDGKVTPMEPKLIVPESWLSRPEGTAFGT